MKKSKFVICATMTVFPMLLTQATSWTNSGTGDWANTLNWDSGVPDGWKETNIKNGGTSIVNNGETVSGAKVSIGGVNESSLIINEGTLNAVWSVWIAEETGTKGYLQINGGKITNGNDNNFIVGRAGEGTLEANGTAQIDADWSFIGGEVIGTTTQANGTGLMTLNDSSFLNDRKGVVVGAGKTSFGVLIVNGNSRAISAGVFYIGHFGGGEAYLYDNALASASEIRIANGANSTGKVVIDNGRMDASSHLLVGVSGDGELIMDGGSVSASSGNAFLGRNANSGGSMTVNNGSFQTNTLYIGYSGTGSTTINAGTVTASGTTWVSGNTGSQGSLYLDGGVLETGRVAAGNGTSSFAFNGGTLRARANADNTNFVGGFSTITLSANGGIIDTNGKNVSVNSAFSGTGTLTKINSGTLTLNADSSMGGLAHNAGTITIADNIGITVSGNTTLATGGTLRFGSNTSLNTAALTLNEGAHIVLNRKRHMKHRRIGV